MDSGQVVRTLRRRLGLSQRALAAQVGCSVGTIAAWETGRHSPQADHLDAVLDVAGLDLALVPRQRASARIQLRRHLCLSLTQRLRLAAGESAVLPLRTCTPVWKELLHLARRGQVMLEPPAATAIWLPLGAIPRITVSVFHAKTPLQSGLVQIRLREGDGPASLIPVPMQDALRLWVLPPGELALPTDEQTSLWSADQLLAAEAPKDLSGRRRPAHRDPDASQEDYRTLQSSQAPFRPDLRDGRAWRLGAPASLAQHVLRG